jgi:tetratricopeptide (TPR) repeat protein
MDLMDFWKRMIRITGVGLLSGVGSAYAVTAVSKAVSERSLAKLADQAQQAILAADYKAARDTYSDILTVQPRNRSAADGEVYAYLELGDFEHARAEEEKILLSDPRPTRPTAINGAAIYLHAKIPMRGVKILIQYLTPLPKVDETAVNALAVCLNNADEHARKTGAYSSATAFYMAQNKKLEKTRPGMKRWGTQWLPQDEADANNAAWSKAITTNAKLANELSQLKAHRAMIVANQGDPVFIQQQQIQEYERSHSLQVADVPPLQELNLPRLDPEIAIEQGKYDQAMKDTQPPPIPDTVEPISVIAVREPVLANAGQMAKPDTTTGSGTAAAPRKNKPPTVVTSTTGAPAPPDTTSPPPDAATTTAPPQEPVEKKIYRVTSYAAAFPVGPDLLVTTAESVAGAKEIDLQLADGSSYPATTVRSDPDSGLALVRVSTVKLGYMGLADQFNGGAVSCVSFPSVDLFSPSASTITGSAAMPKDGWRVHLAETPRLGGGPLLSGGKVVGVEMATRDSDITAIPAVTLDDLKKFLGSDFTPGGNADPMASTVQISATREK